MNLTLDSFGNLTFTNAEGQNFPNIRPVRAFPITDPEGGISLMSEDGHELAWITSIHDLPESESKLLSDNLAQSEFMPVILKISKVSSFATPSIWDIETDRGNTRLKLKAEEDIRRVAVDTLLITDANGLQYLLRNFSSLDTVSRKILDRFL